MHEQVLHDESVCDSIKIPNKMKEKNPNLLYLNTAVLRAPFPKVCKLSGNFLAKKNAGKYVMMLLQLWGKNSHPDCRIRPREVNYEL